MKRLGIALLLTLTLALSCAGQTVGTYQTVQLTLANPPQPPNIAGPPSVVGAQGGSTNYYFWLVSEFTIGNSSLSGPFTCYNAQQTLTSGNYCLVSWVAVNGANSYDLLMTTTPTPPTGACNCAVVIGTTTLTQNVQSNTLSGYTVTTYNAGNAIVDLDNEALGAGLYGLTARTGPLYSSQGFAGYPDSEMQVLPSDCSMFTTTGAFAANTGGAGTITGPAMVRIAANNWVLQGITTAATNSIALECDINPATRTTAGKGVLVTSIELFYGVQTTALTSITAPTMSTVTYSSTGGSAAATLTSAGTLTVTPGTLQLATTTSGQCYSENVSLNTPILLNSKTQRLTLEQIFNQSGAAATQLQFCGAMVYYTNVPL